MQCDVMGYESMEITTRDGGRTWCLAFSRNAGGWVSGQGGSEGGRPHIDWVLISTAFSRGCGVVEVVPFRLGM